MKLRALSVLWFSMITVAGCDRVVLLGTSSTGGGSSASGTSNAVGSVGPAGPAGSSGSGGLSGAGGAPSASSGNALGCGGVPPSDYGNYGGGMPSSGTGGPPIPPIVCASTPSGSSGSGGWTVEPVGAGTFSSTFPPKGCAATACGSVVPSSPESFAMLPQGRWLFCEDVSTSHPSSSGYFTSGIVNPGAAGIEFLSNGSWFALYQTAPGQFGRGAGPQDSGGWQVINNACTGGDGYEVELGTNEANPFTATISPWFWSSPQTMQYPDYTSYDGLVRMARPD